MHDKISYVGKQVELLLLLLLLCCCRSGPWQYKREKSIKQQNNSGFLGNAADYYLLTTLNVTEVIIVS
jgi:hypothetical protein